MIRLIAIAIIAILSSYSSFSQVRNLELHYKVDGESRSHFWMQGLQNQPPTQQPEWSAINHFSYDIILTLLRENLWRIDWKNWQINGFIPESFKPLLDYVQKITPIYVHRYSGGHLQFACPRIKEVWQRQAVGGILWYFQFVRPSRNASEWRVKEAHPSGMIICRYRLVRQTKTVRIYRKSVEEVLIPATEKQMGKQHRIEGYLTYEIDRKGVIMRVSGTLQERVNLYGISTTNTKQAIRITLQKRQQLASSRLLVLRSQVEQVFQSHPRYSLYAPPTEEEQSLLRAQSILQGTQPEQLLKEVVTLRRNLPSDPQRRQDLLTKLALRLESALTLHPDKMFPAIKKMLEQSEAADEFYWTLLRLLTDSSSAEAQAILLEQLGSSSEEKRLAAARQIAWLRRPSPDTFQKLWQQAQSADAEIRSTLEISLSILAKSLPDSAKNLIDQFATWAMNNLQSAIDENNEPNQIHWLRVAINLAHPIFWDTVAKLVKSGSEQVRLLAVEALSKQDIKRAFPVLRSSFEMEPSLSVREAVVFHAVRQGWELSEVRVFIEWAAFNDPELRIRKACVQVLLELAPKSQQAINLLAQIAERNSMPAIRREAMIALAALHASGIKVPDLKGR